MVTMMDFRTNKHSDRVSETKREPPSVVWHKLRSIDVSSVV